MKQLYPILFFLLGVTGPAKATAPDTLRLTLGQVVELARKNSIAAKQAIAVKETKYWQWRTYRSNYQPQLSLSTLFNL